MCRFMPFFRVVACMSVLVSMVVPWVYLLADVREVCLSQDACERVCACVAALSLSIGMLRP